VDIKSIGLGLVLSVFLTSVVSAKGNAKDSANEFVEERASVDVIDASLGNDAALGSVADSTVDSTADLTLPSGNSLSTASLVASLKDTKASTKPAVSNGAIGKMFFGLGGVLIFIFACSWMLKRFNVNKFGMTNSLSVSGVLPIGAKEKVVVVDIEGTRLVLGVTATSITKLHTLDVVDKPSYPIKSKNSEPISSDFSEKMKKIMKEGLKSD